VENMPCKFGDLGKKAGDILSEDHQTSGLAIKSKQKTSWDGAVLTTACDLFAGKGEVQTPGKVTWKFPKPAGFNGLSIDKFEIDKKGGMKLEAVADNNLHKVKDLKIEFKADLSKGLEGITKGITFTGIKDTQIKAEVEPMNPSGFKVEITRSVNIATVGVKFNGAGVPDVGLNVAKGPAFAAVTAGKGLKVFNVFLMYSLNDKMKVAATCSQGAKDGPTFSAGGSFALQPGTSVKAKIDHEQNASLTLKHEISKGVTILTGAAYGVKSAALKYGCQVSVE